MPNQLTKSHLISRLAVSLGLALIACIGLAVKSAVAQPLDALAPSRQAGTERDVMDLSRAWLLVQQNDHTYRAAISEQAATQTQRAQGRAALLPQVQAGYARSKISGDASQPNMFGQRVGRELDYDSSNLYVQLQQPLFSYSRYAEYRRGHALADQGNAVFAVARQETGIRLARAYFSAVLAYENRELQRALTASLADQAKALEARYDRSEGTRTDVEETQARLAIARADIVDAESQLVLAARELEGMLGASPTHLAGLKEEFPLLPLSPSSRVEWRELARANNADVLSAREAVSVAESDVDRAAGRYAPTVDLVATYGKADSENLSTLSQRTNTFTVGIQVNIPIFTGGYTRANVSRARFDRTRLQRELDAAIERADIEVTRQYTNVQGGAQRIKALEAAVESGSLSLASVQKGFELGSWSNLDVLKARDHLYDAKHQLVRARLEYLLARLSLVAAAGQLHSGPFDEITAHYLGAAIPMAYSRPTP